MKSLLSTIDNSRKGKRVCDVGVYPGDNVLSELGIHHTILELPEGLVKLSRGSIPPIIVLTFRFVIDFWTIA